MFFCSRNDLPVRTNLSDHNACYVVISLNSYDRMGKIEWNSASCYFCGMNAISTDSRCGIRKCNDFASCLHELITYNKSDVS